MSAPTPRRGPQVKLVRMAAALPSYAVGRLRNWQIELWDLRERRFPALPIPYFPPEGGVLLLPAHDRLGEMLFKGWPYEVPERRFIATFLRRGMVFFDVGANLGLYTVIAGRRVGRSGRVHSFEPSPAVYEKLRVNVRINRLRNVVANALAVGDSNTSILLTAYGRGWGAYSTVGRAVGVEAPFEEVAVRQVTLDRYAAEHDLRRLDFIKIDVEGSEQAVLRGGESVIWQKLRPVVMCEFSDRRTSVRGYPAHELWHHLDRFRYLWFGLDAPSGRLEPSPPKDEYVYDNLIGIPAEKWESVSTWLALKFGVAPGRAEKC